MEDTGDFNGDGKSDILWQNDNGQAAIWLMNGLNPIAGAAVGSNSGPSGRRHRHVDRFLALEDAIN